MTLEKVQSDQRVVVVNEYPLVDGGTLAVPNDGVPTQVANPGRTTIRSLFQLAVALFSAVPVIVPIILGAWSPEWLAVALGQVVVVQGVVVRIMAIPGVNTWIKVYLPALAAIPLVDPNRE